jgi:PPIC-type PPIASE domain
VIAALRRTLREPLLHFAVLGAGLFGAYQVVAPAPADTSAIVVSGDQIVSLAEQFRASWQRPPSREELEHLIQARVRDEVLYREGVALGLDRDDPVVRNRVRQKMEALTEDVLTEEPTDAELQAYLDAHPDLFAVPALVSFEQRYFDPGRRTVLDADLRRAHDVLRAGGTVHGDRTMLPGRMDNALDADVQAAFGEAFAKAIQAAPVGVWFEPIQSSFGYHLVRVTGRTAATVPRLADARSVVAREWSRARTVEGREQLYRSLRARYTIEVAGIPETAPVTARAGGRP